MKMNTFLASCLTLFAVISLSVADETENPQIAQMPEFKAALAKAEATLKNVPPATDEQKNAMRQALEFLTIEHIKIEISDPDSSLHETFKKLPAIFDQILNGKLKGKLPKFFVSEIQKQSKQTADIYEKIKNIEHATESPEFIQFLQTKEEELFIYETYVKRELGKTANEISGEFYLKIGSFFGKVQSNIENYPTLKAIQNDIEKAKTDAEQIDLGKAFRRETLRLALAELKKSKK